MAYDRELAAAKKAASLSARLCEEVQKALLQSDVQSKSDESPVTVADYGSQALVSSMLQRKLSYEPFSLVAEDDSGDLHKDGAQETLERITTLVNDILASDGSYSVYTLSTEDVLMAIDSGKSKGGSQGKHWVLDPIDATKGFLGGDQYAISLSLLDEGKAVLGILAYPNLLLTSIVQVSAIDNPEEASFFESYEAVHSMHDLSSSIAKKLGVKALTVRIDSQAKYGALSRGEGPIYLRFPHKGYREKI